MIKKIKIQKRLYEKLEDLKNKIIEMREQIAIAKERESSLKTQLQVMEKIAEKIKENK